MNTPITRVHQIELSSVCNLRCRYCPHPGLEREKTHMPWEVYTAAIDWARELKGTELSFTGMGEALLHPNFNLMIPYARQRLPSAWFLLATNGVVLMDKDEQFVEKLIITIKASNVSIYVSTHRPEVAGPAVEKLLKAGCHVGTNTAFVTSGFNWAGQVDWHGAAAPRTECQYLKQGWVAVLQNGDIVNCCMDAHGKYPIGNVLDLNLPKYLQPIKLCESCHLKVPT